MRRAPSKTSPDVAIPAPDVDPIAGAGATPSGASQVARPTRSQRREDPVQEYFSIGEVCALADLKPHVLRYWETQFRVLSPAKNRSGNRVYARREVELVLLVKHLLYTEKFTVDGARQKLDEHRRGRVLRSTARQAFSREMAESLERALRDVVDLLEGRRAPSARMDAGGAGQG